MGHVNKINNTNQSLIPHTNLKILIWNANGVKSKQYELAQFLQNHKVDIALISETRMKSTARWSLPNYYIYRTDPDTRPGGGTGGGTAILINKSIKHHPAGTNPDCTSIILPNDNGNICVTAIYSQPYKNDLQEAIDHSISMAPFYIIGGDPNSRSPAWGNRNYNKNGRILESLAEAHEFSILGPNEPTFYPRNQNNLPSILDIFITNTELLSEIKVIQELSSDHLPVLASLALPHTFKLHKKTLLETNWDTYKHNIQENFPNLQGAVEDIDTEIKLLTDTITMHIKKATIQIQKANTHQVGNQVLNDLIKERNRKRKSYQQYKTEELKKEVSKLNYKIRTESDKHKNKLWEEKIQDISKDRAGLWKLNSILSGKKIKTYTPAIHGERGIVYDAQDKAEAIADSLELQFQPNHHLVDENHLANIQRKIREEENKHPHSRFDKIKLQETITAIKTLPDKKAPGPDKIPNEALKRLPITAISHLTKIFNKMMEDSHYPSNWKLAKIITLPKPGKNGMFPQNRRPISLLNTMVKVFEKIIIKRLQKTVDKKKLLPNQQIGFRQNHSTIHAASRVAKYIVKGYNNKKSTLLLCMDIEKAFDKVHHDFLIYKLIQAKIPSPFWKIIRSSFKNRKFQVTMDGKLSSPKPIQAGVPQGSVLSPLMYALYTRDTPKQEGTAFTLYADDTAIYAKDKNIRFAKTLLQEFINKLENYWNTWAIKVNPTKSALMCFTRKRTQDNRIITLFGEPLQTINTAKYLGIIFDNKLNWKPHLQQATRAAMGKFVKLYPLMKAGGLPKKAKLLIYKAVIRTAMLYGAEVWGTAAKIHTAPLQVTQNKILRCILQARRGTPIDLLHERAEMDPVNRRVREMNHRFYASIRQHDNPLVNRLGTYNNRDRRTLVI